MSADNLVMNAGKSKTAQRGALNAPKATPEQIRLAKLLNNSSSEHTEELQFKLQQVRECTASSIETAFSALRDADNDVQVAIELILDGNCEDSWMDPFAKKTKAKKQHEQKSKVEKGKEQPKTGSNQSLNDKKASANADAPKKPAKQDGNKKGARQANQAKNGSNKPPRKPRTELPLGDEWTVECDEWKGETIEVVNSCVDSPVNLQEDSELLKLVTTQDVEPPTEQSVQEEEAKAPVEEHEEPVKEVKEKPTVQEESTSEVMDAVQRVKARLFSTYTQSVTPPSSVHSQLPVFFAPGSTVFPLRDEASSIQFGTNYVSSPNFNSNIFAGQDLSKSRPVAASVQQKSARTEPAQETFTPTIPPHVTPVAPMIQSDQAFTSAPLQQPNVASASVQKESFSKIQENQTQGAHPQQSQTVNNFENPYNYNLLGELSQNMKNVDLQDMQVGKSDAFTQSASSTQPDNMPTASYQFPASKLSVGGMPQQGQQINKPISIIPPNTGPQQSQQSMPTTQAAPLPQPFMHFPHLMSQLQQNMPFFNFPQPPATSAPTMFDLDHLQAFHQQRMLYEMQSHASAPAQTVANDNSNNNVSNTADVMASNKPTNMPQPPQPPIHQVTTTNSGYFVPYGLNSGMVLMNSYPNTFVGQQQQQASVTQQSQNPSTGPHGASPLSHTGNNQFAKPISAPTNFSAYQNVRQANFEEVNDMFYPNLSKQMSFKQGYYNPPKPDMGNKLQQQAGGMSPSQQGGPSSQVQQQQGGSNQVQPPNIYSQQGQGQYPFYQAQAIVAAAVAAQNQQPNQASQSTGGATGQGPSGMDRWYSRVDGLGFYDAVKCGSIDAVVGEDIPPHDRAVCRAQAAKYRPSEASFPERDFKFWSEGKLEEMGKASLFIGRLHPNIQHDQLHSTLSRLLSVVKHAEREGKHRRKDRHHSHHHHRSHTRSPEQHKSRTKDSLWPLVRVVKHPITGESRGYAFAWFKSSRDANRVLESWRCSSNFFKPSGCSEGVRVDLGSIFVDMLGFEQMILEPCFSRTLPGWKPRRLGGGLGGFKESGQLRFGGIARPFRQLLRKTSP